MLKEIHHNFIMMLYEMIMPVKNNNSRTFTKAMVQGQTIFEYDSNSAAGQAIRKLWGSLLEKL